MEDYEISVQELSKRDADSYILIDIRDDSSYSYGNIPGSLHVPKDILEADYEKYKDKPLILYCKKGETSAETVQFLKEKNIEAKSLKGGYLAWLMESMKQEEEQQDVYLDIEQSIRKKFKKSIWCKFTKAVREYELVKEGDKIAVCISGGKDSMLMAKLFQELQRHNRFPFEVTFLVMDPGYSKENRQIIENNAKKLHIPLTIFESDIFEAVLHVEKSPCYLCARMRRGHLYAKAKELGCNFVRLAHYPHNEEMVREAERMGFLVWSEIPVYWTIHWENKDTYQNAEQQLCDMIARDKNRCNIIIWSIANETPHSKTRLTFLSNLANKARSLDSVRLIGAAMEKEEVQPGVLTVNDPLGELLDIISFNEYVGWYDGDSEKCDRVNWTFDTQKPVFISELGGGALYGHHGSPKERFTEEYQEDLYIRHVNMLKRIPGLAGTTPWILKDFRSPRRHVPEIQDDFNRKGLVSDKGQKKKAFFVLQKWYKELTEAYK